MGTNNTANKKVNNKCKGIKMRIATIGQPGAGKSTLSQILSGIFDVMVISSGDLARASGFANSDAEKGGKLDPDEEKIRRMVKEAIGTSDQYILDGFPRTISQIQDIDIPLDAVLYLSLGHKGTHIGAERLLARGRPDDTLEIIGARIATYYSFTHPLVDYFMDQEKLVYINAIGTIAQTLRQAVVQLAARGIVEASTYINELIRDFEYDYTVKTRIHREAGDTNKER
jgi:adenylate kinase